MKNNKYYYIILNSLSGCIIIFLDKSWIATTVTDVMKQYHLPEDDYIEVMTLALKQLDLYDQMRFLCKPTKPGFKMTKLIMWQAISKFWNDYSVESTNTKQIAKLKVTDKLY